MLCSDHFEEWIYEPWDWTCSGEIIWTNGYSMEAMELDGAKFGYKEFTDITSLSYTCSAGKTDPLAQFSSDAGAHYAVRV